MLSVTNLFSSLRTWHTKLFLLDRLCHREQHIALLDENVPRLDEESNHIVLSTHTHVQHACERAAATHTYPRSHSHCNTNTHV